jgi:hypothetical protein
MANTTFSGPIISNNGFTSTGIAFADLPTATANTGRIIFCSDARKVAETAGNGTGNLLFSDGANWIRVDTGATATA